MAVHFNARIYGEVFANPPFTNADNATAFSNTKDFPSGRLANFPTVGTTIWPLPNGVKVGNPGFYCYSIVEVAPTGLNVHSTKYASDSLAATIASAIA
jgi:hypothetical protein